MRARPGSWRYVVFVASAAVVAGTMSRAEDGGAAPRSRIRLQTLRDIHLAVEICWRANLPPLAHAIPGMTVTVRAAFTRSGEIFGEPVFTFVTPGVSTEARAMYQRAASNALGRCTPLPFSDGLGNAVAGQPRVFIFTDRRNEKRA